MLARGMTKSLREELVYSPYYDKTKNGSKEDFVIPIPQAMASNGCSIVHETRAMKRMFELTHELTSALFQADEIHWFHAIARHINVEIKKKATFFGRYGTQ